MYQNIGQGAPGQNNNVGNFDASKYWTSTPSSDLGSWQVDFVNGQATGFLRSNEIRIRPIRAF